MPEQQIVTVATYTSPDAASLARLELEQHGVRCELGGDDLSSTLSYFGGAVSKIDLFVAKKDFDQALKILQQAQVEAQAKQAADPWGDDDEYGWECASCREANERRFDICWSCGEDRPANPERVLLPDASDDQDRVEPVAVASELTAEAESPYRPPGIQNPVIRRASGDSTSDRAFRAALFTIAFPPLGLYAAWLIVRLVLRGEATRRAWLAAAVLLVLTVVWGIFIAADLMH